MVQGKVIIMNDMTHHALIGQISWFVSGVVVSPVDNQIDTWMEDDLTLFTLLGRGSSNFGTKIDYWKTSLVTRGLMEMR